MNRRAGTIVASALLLALNDSARPNVARAADPLPSAAAMTPSAVDISDALTFRKDHALNTDAVLVERALTDGSYDSESFGVPLSRDEVAEIYRQLEIQSALEPAVALAADAYGFVGARIQPGADRLTITLSSANAVLAASLATLMPEGVELEFRRVDATLAELQSLRDKIAASWNDWPDNAQPSAVGIDTDTGMVEIDLLETSLAATSYLKDRYGRNVKIEQAPAVHLLACTINDCGTAGGVGVIGKETGNAAVICTSGYLVREQGDPSDGPFMATAGHCIQDAGGSSSGNLPWENYNSHTLTWGRNVNNFRNPVGGANIDIGYFRLGGNVPADRNNYFRTAAFGTFSITSNTLNSGQTIGTTVCRAGYGTFLNTGGGTWTCGSVSQTDFTFNCGSNCTLTHAWKANIHSYHGDSGAGMIKASSTFSAAGTLSGGSDSSPFFTTYTTYQTARDQIGIIACLTTQC